jgi:hypothetical protein
LLVHNYAQHRQHTDCLDTPCMSIQRKKKDTM